MRFDHVWQWFLEAAIVLSEGLRLQHLKHNVTGVSQYICYCVLGIFGDCKRTSAATCRTTSCAACFPHLHCHITLPEHNYATCLPHLHCHSTRTVPDVCHICIVTLPEYNYATCLPHLHCHTTRTQLCHMFAISPLYKWATLKHIEKCLIRLCVFSVFNMCQKGYLSTLYIWHWLKNVRQSCFF